MQQLAIIGGGASGFMCAVEVASQRNDVHVTILEKNTAVLQKVKVSGGGRCNTTHACFRTSELLKQYPRGKSFLKKSFAQFSTQDTIQWFSAKGVDLIAEEDGRMFPSTNSSQTIMDVFLHACNRLNISIQTKTEVIDISKSASSFQIKTKNGKTIEANKVMIACGGFNKLESYNWIERLGHNIQPPIPSLFTFNLKTHDMKDLMGISVNNAQVRIVGSNMVEVGPLLITHWGFSGPAILKLSAFAAKELYHAHYEFDIMINWISKNETDLRTSWNAIRNSMGGQKLSNRNPFDLPQRLWFHLLQQAGLNEENKWSELNSKEQNKLMHELTSSLFSVKGKTTFKEEFVSCGGVSAEEVHANTMESKLIPGLFFGGEVLDVDGVTGGFNFQHAWTSGFLAAKQIAKSI